jgi:hypothetical protein
MVFLRPKGPMLKSVWFWKGKLIRLETGFGICFCRSSGAPACDAPKDPVLSGMVGGDPWATPRSAVSRTKVRSASDLIIHRRLPWLGLPLLGLRAIANNVTFDMEVQVSYKRFRRAGLLGSARGLLSRATRGVHGSRGGYSSGLPVA